MTAELAWLPPHVRGGKARMQKLKQTLEAQGSDLATYQRSLYDRAIALHPDLSQRGARAANQAQLDAWGLQGYIQQRREAFRACAAKYGANFARQRVQHATEIRRQHRLIHPTRGERALRDLLIDLGFELVVERTPFDYCRWRVAPEEYAWPDRYPVAITQRSAIVEAYVGTMICDVLLPTHQLALEVYGGIHTMTCERDAHREAFLGTQQLRVLVLTEDDACHPCTTQQQILQLLGEVPICW